MRIHHIELQAFGSFPGTERIDFDALADSGLFLLSGPTGAGKTTILDAICFALYNEVPGARRGRTDELRCHHADEDTLTQVVLEASIAGRRLEITRIPAQLRRRRRGAGMTNQTAQVAVREFVNGEWVARASRQEDTKLLVEELLRLSASQFQQVVLLPQGRFAEFLRASSADRLPLLQALFDTSRFVDIEDWLREEERRTGKVVRNLDEKITFAIENLARELDVDPPDPAEGLNWLDDVLEWQDALKTAADKAVQAAASILHDSNEVAERERRLASDQQSHGEAVARHEELEARQPEDDAKRARLSQARRAERVRPLLDECRRLTDELAEAEEGRHQATTRLDAVRPGRSSDSDEDLERTRDELILRIGTIDDAIEIESVELPAARGKVAIATKALEEEERNLRAVTAALDEHKRSLEQDQATLARREDARQAHPDAITAKEVADQALRDGKQLAGLQDDRGKAAGKLEAAEAAQRSARERKVEVLGRRLAGLAAELAAELEAGSPCPVCGADEHPVPATPTDAHATQDELEAAEGLLLEANDELTRLRTQVEDLEVRIAQLDGALGHRSLDELQDAVLKANQAEGDLAAAIEAGNEAAKRLAAAEEIREGLVQRKHAHELRTPVLQLELKNANLLVERLEGKVRDARGDHTSLAEHRRLVDEERGAIVELLELRRRTTALTGQLEQTRKNAEAEASSAGFDSLAAATAAVLHDDDLAALDEEVCQIDNERARVKGILSDERLQRASLAPPADPRAAEERAAEAHETHTQRVTEAASVAARHGLIDRCRSEVRTWNDERGPLGERHNVVRTLFNLARGETGGASANQRMRLTSYVLSARLQLVAEAASTRLHHMSQGRYSLRQTDEAATGREAGGLGLEVVDAYSNSTRSTNSLSGGESFAASLALALGLADVVAAEAGGATLDTLFIDEGFGSLDEDSLGSVLDILDDLRSGGRTIGVVSHVSEMKDRIPIHLTIEKSDRGSRIVT